MWVKAPYYTAALLLHDDRVIDAAPILKWMIGKKRQYCAQYFKNRRFKVIYLYD